MLERLLLMVLKRAAHNLKSVRTQTNRHITICCRIIRALRILKNLGPGKWRNKIKMRYINKRSYHICTFGKLSKSPCHFHFFVRSRCALCCWLISLFNVCFFGACTRTRLHAMHTFASLSVFFLLWCVPVGECVSRHYKHTHTTWWSLGIVNIYHNHVWRNIFIFRSLPCAIRHTLYASMRSL